MADGENQLLIRDGGDDEDEGGGVDEGLIIQLSKRDSGGVTGHRSMRSRRRSTEVSMIVNRNFESLLCMIAQ